MLQPCQNLSSSSVHAALCLHSSWDRRCCAAPCLVPDGCALAPADPRTELLTKHTSAFSRKTNKASWLLPAQQGSNFWFIFTVLLYCSTSLYYRKLSWYFVWNQDKQTLFTFYTVILPRADFLKVHPDLGQYLRDCKPFHGSVSQYSSKPQTNIVRIEMKYLTSWSPECQSCITVCRNTAREVFWRINKNSIE